MVETTIPRSAVARPVTSAPEDRPGFAKLLHPTGIPMIPTRNLQETTIVTESSGTNLARYFVILSPRETRGLTGPFTVFQLRERYVTEVINGRTLVWEYGNIIWHELRHLPLLYSEVQRPEIPHRETPRNIRTLATLESNLLRSNEIDRDVAGNDQTILIASLSRICIKCGAVAIACTQRRGEQSFPEFITNRLGSALPHQVASEVIPGFLWTGNAGSGRISTIEALGITLAINCTETIKTPSSHPPHYRSISSPLREWMADKTSGKFTSIANIHKTFESVCAIIDRHRSHYEREEESDRSVVKDKIVPPRYTGPVDMKGCPKLPLLHMTSKLALKLRSFSPSVEGRGRKASPQLQLEVGMGSSKIGLTGPLPDPRLLLWSRLGIDRPCAVAAAYLVKRWGLGLDTALQHIRVTRTGMNISKPYMDALLSWEKLYAMGDSYCCDCLEASVLSSPSRSSYPQSTLPGISSTTSRVLAKHTGENNYPTTSSNMSTSQGVLISRGIEREQSKDSDRHGGYITHLATFISSLATKDISDRVDLGPIDSYLISAHAMDHSDTSKSFPSTPATAVLLRLGGRGLGDDMMSAVFKAISCSSITACLVDADLQGNRLTCAAIAVICDSFLLSITPTSTPALSDGQNMLVNSGVKGTERERGRDTVTRPVQIPLRRLNLAHNFIAGPGAVSLSKLMLMCFELRELDVSGNPLGDAGCAVITACLAALNTEFFEDEDEDEEEEDDANSDRGGNTAECPKQLSTLRIGGSGLGCEGIAGISDALARSSSLTSLSVDYSPDVSPSSMAGLMTALRLNVNSLTKLSLADSNLRVETFSHLFDASHGGHIALTCLDISRCSLTSEHLENLLTQSMLLPLQHCSTTLHLVPPNRSLLHRLMELNMSGNKIMDCGLYALTSLLTGTQNNAQDIMSEHTVGQETLPLTHLNISDCGITAVGFTAVIKAVSLLADAAPGCLSMYLRHLDASFNTLGPGIFLTQDPRHSFSLSIEHSSVENVEGSGNRITGTSDVVCGTGCLQLLSRCHLRELILNRIDMRCNSAVCLLRLLCPVGDDYKCTTPLGLSLKTLRIGDNNLCDGLVIAAAIRDVKGKNCTLELLDLDFNNFTEQTVDLVSGICTVIGPGTERRTGTGTGMDRGAGRGRDDIRQRLLPLHISMTGNRCVTYALYTPVRSIESRCGLAPTASKPPLTRNYAPQADISDSLLVPAYPDAQHIITRSSPTLGATHTHTHSHIKRSDEGVNYSDVLLSSRVDISVRQQVEQRKALLEYYLKNYGPDIPHGHVR